VLWWIIEDDASLHRILGKYILAAHDAVMLFDSGTKANAAIQQVAEDNVPHAICVDLGLPGISGWTLIRTLHAHPLFQHTAVVAMSARVDVTDHASALEAGADAFIAKPFRPAELLALGHRIAKEKQS
jgi:DNA-binding response OmpR family regulator